jgi:hypothetical protein
MRQEYAESIFSQKEVTLPLSIVIVLFVGISRIYNGFHAPLDVFFGIVLGVVMLSLWFFGFKDIIDCAGSPSSNLYVMPIFVICLGALILFFHPRPLYPTCSLLESSQLIGIAVGAVISMRFVMEYRIPVNFFPTEALLPKYLPGLYSLMLKSPLLFHFTRFFFGWLSYETARFIGKGIGRNVFPILVSFYDNLTAKNIPHNTEGYILAYTAQGMVKIKKSEIREKDREQTVLVLTKFMTYMLVAAGVGIAAPILFQYLGLYLARDARMIKSVCTLY